MGMDVYGLDPKIHKGTKKPERPGNLHKGASRVVIDKYFKEENEYEDKNPGVYFRNNCWWWRPLAYFISEHCDWLTTEQKERLQDNSGFDFSEDEALSIADTLQKKVDDGTAKDREEVNKKETGNKSIVPYDYPTDIKKKWDDLQKSTDRRAHYPFRKMNVERFICFLRECGGFQVC